MKFLQRDVDAIPVLSLVPSRRRRSVTLHIVLLTVFPHIVYPRIALIAVEWDPVKNLCTIAVPDLTTASLIKLFEIQNYVIFLNQ